MKNSIKYKVLTKEIEIKDILKSKIRDEMICQNCKMLMNKPYIVDCEHNFCEDCVKDLNSCPIDGKEIVYKILRNKLNIEIGNLKIFCPYEKELCSWENKLSELEKHLIECSHQKEFCSNNCLQLINMREVEGHLKYHCPKRSINCIHCGEVVFQCDLTKHYKNNCLKIEFICPNNCGMKQITKENINDHIPLCPNTCKTCFICKKDFKNCEITQHLEDNLYDHLKNTIDIFEQNHKRIKTLEEENKRNYLIMMKHKEKICSLEEENLRQSEKIMSLEKETKLSYSISLKHNEKIISLEEENINLLKELKILQEENEQEHKEMKSQIKSLNLNILESKINSSKVRFKDKIFNEEEIDIIIKGIKSNEDLKELEIKNCGLGENLAQFKLLINAIKDNNSIEKLNLFGNDLGKDPNIIKELANLIRNDNKIKLLQIGNNNLGCNAENMNILSNAIVENSCMLELFLSGNNLGKFFKNENMQALEKILNKNNHLDQIYLPNNNFCSYKENLQPFLIGMLGHFKDITYGEFPKYMDSNSEIKSKDENLKSFAEFLNGHFTDIKLSIGCYAYSNKWRGLKFFNFKFRQESFWRQITFEEKDEDINKMKQYLIDSGFDFKFEI